LCGLLSVFKNCNDGTIHVQFVTARATVVYGPYIHTYFLSNTTYTMFLAQGSTVSPQNITGTRLARNTVLNFIGQALPLLVGILVIPFIIRSLGTERFGILTLAWIVIGYFSLFDMGLSRATTKFVAEIISRGKSEKLPALV